MSEHREAILKFWAAGKSAGEIGKTLKITRSTVIGVVHRARVKGVEVDPQGWHKSEGGWRLSSRPYPRKKLPAQPKAVTIRPLPERLAPKPRTGPWVPLLDCDPGTCRYTLSGKLFCNEPATRGSYCDEHHAVVRIPLKEKRA